jgi:hypothetical protein
MIGNQEFLRMSYGMDNKSITNKIITSLASESS